MITRKLNSIILYSSRILNLAIFLYFAVLLGKFTWWLITPTLPDIYVEKITAHQFDNSIKMIINRYPFGIVIVQKTEDVPIPTIAEQITLTGVYASEESKDSFAMIDYNNKSIVLRIGEVIADDAILSAISAESITIIQGNNETSIKLNGIVPAKNRTPPTYINDSTHSIQFYSETEKKDYQKALSHNNYERRNNKYNYEDKLTSTSDTKDSEFDDEHYRKILTEYAKKLIASAEYDDHTQDE